MHTILTYCVQWADGSLDRNTHREELDALEEMGLIEAADDTGFKLYYKASEKSLYDLPEL